MTKGSACFDWDVAASVPGNHFVHNDGGSLAGAVVIPGPRSRASGGISEMDPTRFPGYGSSNAPTAIAAPARGPPRARSSGQRLSQFKGSWTVEEDRLLRAKVQEFDIGRWTKVAMYLPDRSGKQCRERWTNQLDPNIESEEDISVKQAQSHQLAQLLAPQLPSRG